LAAHVFPDVRQASFKDRHFPSVHLPLQHAPSLEHCASSFAHAVDEHTPLLHASVQQSVLDEHAPPDATHRPTVDTQVCEATLQSAEQH
jgi:hypothetical protein